VASANCALYCGAEVDFVDIDPRSFNMCPVEFEKKLVIAKQNGRLPKIVIPVHMCGQACDMQAIYALSQKYGFKIIEDASHAIGARYKGEPVGNGKYSDMTVFSFHPVKIITTGEGGMVVTNNAVHAKNLMRLRSHGISSDPADMVEHPGDQIWNYQQLQLGFNYRMTELQAALGMSQLKQLDTFVNKRHSIAAMYDKLLGGLTLQTPWQHPDSYSSYHLYPIQIAASGSNVSQQKIYQAMHLAGIQANLHYIPVYLQPFYAAMGFKPGYCPHAENYYKQTISIPMFSSMTNEEQSHVIHTLDKALAGQSRRKKEKVIM
jgi:dTDP-4-amino-4,6-dideoxygalactose transaminase